MTNSMTTIKLFKQPTGNTCGPACIYMAWYHLINKDNTIQFDVDMKYTIEDVANFCTTDWVVGTPPEKMTLGLNALNLKYVEYISSPHPFDLLKTVIDNGNIPLLRTLTQGIPHWIIVDGYDENYYSVKDPWLGEIKYNHEDLDYVWRGRNYQFFDSPFSTRLIISVLASWVFLFFAQRIFARMAGTVVVDL